MDQKLFAPYPVTDRVSEHILVLVMWLNHATATQTQPAYRTDAPSVTQEFAAFCVQYQSHTQLQREMLPTFFGAQSPTSPVYPEVENVSCTSPTANFYVVS
jgi:hypothetical protein